MTDPEKGWDLGRETSHIRVGKAYGFTVDEIQLHEPGLTDDVRKAFAEQASRRTEDFFWQHVNDPSPRPEHWNCRCTVNPQYADGEPYPYDPLADIEIISDPDDLRGINAKRVRVVA